MVIFGHEIFKNYGEFSQIFHLVVSSVWFALLIRIFLLVVFIKITDIIISKIRKHLSEKADTFEAKKQVVTMVGLVRNVIFTVIAILFCTAFLGKLGIDIKPFLATAGVAGLAVGFASKRFIEDIIEGFIIISSGQIRIGDYVEINGKKGTVEKLDLKMVTLRDVNGNVHFIRNGLIEIVTNYTSTYSVAYMELDVAYTENPDRVISVITDIFHNQLKKQPGMENKIISDIEVAGLTSFASSSIKIRTTIKTQPKMQWAVQFEFNKLILERFKRENIEIPYNYINAIVKQN